MSLTANGLSVSRVLNLSPIAFLYVFDTTLRGLPSDLQQRAYFRDQVRVNFTCHLLCFGIELSRFSGQICLTKPPRASRTVQVRWHGSLGANESRVLVEDHQQFLDRNRIPLVTGTISASSLRVKRRQYAIILGGPRGSTNGHPPSSVLSASCD